MSNKTAKETAKILSAVPNTKKVGREFLDVEILFTLGKKKEVLKFGYPLDTKPAEIKKDIEKKIVVREQERNPTKPPQDTKEQKAATKTAKAIEGITI